MLSAEFPSETQNYNKLVMRDYKFRLEENSRPPLRRTHLPWMVLLVGAVAILSFLGFTPEQASATKEQSIGDIAVERGLSLRESALDRQISIDLALPPPPPSDAPIVEPEPQVAEELTWSTLEVRRGDTLAGLFSRNGYSARELHQILQLGKPVSVLKRIYPGNQIQIAADDQKQIHKIVYKLKPTLTLTVTRTEDGFSAENVERHYEKRLAHASATIENSLFTAATNAGMSERLTMELAGIFGWDIDFALDIRTGDSFSLIYEELYLDGEKVKEGQIVAAEFINQGREVQAIHFSKKDGVSDYYSPDGRSMRKAFLRSPVDFRRISSRFRGSRWHPVLGKRRPHRGVDYAAATGTPIKASGDGKVIYAGRKGGYGKTVIVRHGQTYTTLYAHMSRIARGMRKGKRVRQGQTIGYVGSTGLATGPHLHYEFRVNGAHRNPLTVKLPHAKPLEAHYRDAFSKRAEHLLSQLSTMTRLTVAQSTVTD